MLKYSDQDKANALATLDANGGNLVLTAAQLGIPRSTIKSWRGGIGVHESVARSRHEKRNVLRQLYQAEAEAALKLAATKRKEATYQQLMTAAAISTDKLAALDAADAVNPADLFDRMEAIARVLAERIQDVDLLATIAQDLDEIEKQYAAPLSGGPAPPGSVPQIGAADPAGAPGATPAPEDPNEGPAAHPA